MIREGWGIVLSFYLCRCKCIILKCQTVILFFCPLQGAFAIVCHSYTEEQVERNGKTFGESGEQRKTETFHTRRRKVD